MSEECFGCEYLDSECDAAGGGIYKCRKHPGIIVGEFGYWADENDIPRRIFEDCPR